MMGLLPIEPFFPEERTGVGEEEKEPVNFQTDFNSKFEPLEQCANMIFVTFLVWWGVSGEWVY